MNETAKMIAEYLQVAAHCEERREVAPTAQLARQWEEAADFWRAEAVALEAQAA